jgi:CHAD domain-containing protein
VLLDGRDRGEWTLLDTFDGRFARKGRRLIWLRDVDQSVLALANAGDDVGDARLAVSLPERPEFAGELPPGLLHDQVERISGVRRLHPVASIEEHSSRYRILDDEEKTLVRLRFAASMARDPERADRAVAVPAVLRVGEVRGYQHDFQEVARFLTEERGLQPVAADTGEQALTALGRRAGTTARIDVAMLPNDAAVRVALSIQRALLEVMRANLAGIRSDSDSEHLHDFRVAVRRSRTLLKTFGGLLTGPEVETILGGLEWLGGETGPTRDADVHLLALDRAAGDLPPGDREALRPLIENLSARRHTAWKGLVQAIDSPRFARLMEQLEAFSDPRGALACACPQTPTIAEFAAPQISDGYRRLLRRGRKLRRDSPDAAVHRARIAGKRLRYLLEFFRSLYPPKRMDPVIKSLRRLQDELGDFNDAAVQQQVLRELASNRAAGGDSSAGELIALGRLVDRLEREQEHCRAGAARRFTRFDSGSTLECFEALEGAREDAPSLGEST